MQVVHGDLNDYNVLVNRKLMGGEGRGVGMYGTRGADSKGTRGAGSEAGGGFSFRKWLGNRFRPDAGSVSVTAAGLTILDFGDIVYSARVYDLAIALAYVCQNKSDGQTALSTACAVVRGYSAYANAHTSAQPSRALGRKELRLLHACVCVRLAQSVLISAHAIGEDPSNSEYIAINSASGWALMRQWSDLSPSDAESAYVTAAAEGAGQSPPFLPAHILAVLRWAQPDEPPIRRNLLFTGALVGAAAVLVLAVGVAAVRTIARHI
mmetsp:Transcript_19253/g.45332  ORF Transcript_19253/g.45332 Transcript_19253/m.45332 type:complete len:266 (+) Transcript_19253:415-1212(+)